MQKLEKTASRNQMTEILAELFRKAQGKEIGKICYLLQGRVAPLYEAIEFGLAEKLIMRAIASACGVEPAVVTREFKKVGDLGSTVQSLKTAKYQSNKAENKKVNVMHVFKTLTLLANTAGEGSQEQKVQLLADLIRELDPLSARYIVRIPLDKLRLGFSEMTILDALSWMLGGDKSQREKLETAYNVRPDIGYIAQTLKAQGIGGLAHVKVKVGVPIIPCLCQRLPTAQEMIKKMGEVAVEPKYDGVRLQLHYQKRQGVKTFSRNLENTTAMFPELQQIGKQLNAQEAILDSEAIGVDYQTDRFIPFQETMTRKRKHEIAEARQSVPLKFFVFDLLYLDGQNLLTKPLIERRKLLEQTVKKGEILVVSPQIVTTSPRELRKYHDQQLKKGLEGVVVKKWHSPYEPGRRGYSWVKFKEEEGRTGKLSDTIDGVVMGYYRGQGRRTGFGIGAFLVGVRQGDNLVTLSKVGTGVSDELWQELQVKLHKLRAKDQPKAYREVSKALVPDVWVEPKVVVEIAGDDLTKSPLHGAGIAVRFPRLVRVRKDKSPQEATSVGEVEQMYKNQKAAHF